MNQPKNKLITLTIIVNICFLIIMPHTNKARAIDTKAETAIIVDAETGYILYEKAVDEPLPPASMTKMMTQYLVLEAISKGDIAWDTKTTISDYAYWLSSKNDFSGIGLIKDKEYSVKELYEAMAINSDNGTTVTLAELIAGSEDGFVQLMNEKVKELSLNNTQFVNATGIDNILLEGKHPKSTKKDDTNLMSARDAAKLGYYLVNDYPKALEISSMVKTTFDNIEIRNSNWMLNHKEPSLQPYYYEGVNGLKTGYTDLAGYTLTATAEKNNKKLITVVMKTESEDERFKETKKLFDYGFNDFEQTELYPAHFQLEDQSIVAVEKGKNDSVEIETAQAIDLPIEKGTEKAYQLVYQFDEALLNENDQLEAPIKKGEKIGSAQLIPNETVTFGSILDEDKTITVDLVTKESIEKQNWFSLMLNAMNKLFND